HRAAHVGRDGEVGVGDVVEHVAIGPYHDPGRVGGRDGGQGHGLGSIVGRGGDQGVRVGVPAVHGEQDIHLAAVHGCVVGAGHAPGHGLGAAGGPADVGVGLGHEERPGATAHGDHAVGLGGAAGAG